MSRIKILPEGLSNKIAAGEVIERPASVVKELLENAIDAQSSRILLEVENGGRSLIRISDDGIGMGHDDALLSLERYATSKIDSDRDLFSIRTLGFRGEAIPSIASVSRMILISNDQPDSPGTEIHIEGGKIKNVLQVGAPKGTMVTVKELFFNIPARRKFMKEPRTEMGHIADIFDRIALGHARIHFDLLSDGKPLKRYSIAESPFVRVMEIFGKTARDQMIRLDLKTPEVSLSGWISTPKETRSTSRWIYIYVNDRFVRDRIVMHALLEGYRGKMVKGAFPAAVLFLQIPSDQVDVNVHPTKNEVRFLKSHGIHESISSHVRDALHKAGQFHWIPVAKLPASDVSVSETIASYVSESGTKESHLDQRISKECRPCSQNSIWASPPLDILRVIGQFRNTYILCETRDALILIDQHAAHERILFERIKNMEKTEENPGQRLLIPEVIELGFREMEWLERLMIPLAGFQFEFEPFGKNSMVVKTIPSILSGADITRILTEMVEHAAERGFPPSIEDVIDHSLAVMACHAAVRANQSLAREHMEGLVDDLRKCVNPAHCPHGRPVFIQWSLNFLEKEFQRIV
ncbi:MAG: DNA mismatch repair endonuclease MutL [Thermodesulfobacteriota bacterium]